MKIIFWLLVALDLAALGLFFLLGLAAAPSSRTSPLAVAGAMLVVPCLVLGAAIWLFLRSSSPGLRALALLVAAAPLLFVVVLRAKAIADIRLNSDASGELTFFHDGPLRDIAVAIKTNDSATVARILPQVNVNERGLQKTTLLMVALRQLRETPQEHAVLRVLIKGGADPNLGAIELPLNMAILESPDAGVEPVKLLLEAGAKPNVKDTFGTPIFFTAAGITMKPEVLTTLLEHGADLKTLDKDGRSILWYAGLASNWPCVLFLLERGIDATQGRSLDGMTFREKAESDARTYGDGKGLAEVIAWLHAH